MKSILSILTAAIVWSCAATPEVRVRTVDERIAVFHRPVELKIGWRIYTEPGTVQTSDSTWRVSSDGLHRGLIPVILVSYPDSSKNVWIEMTTDDAMLGRLLKQSLMTQKPIEKPIREFLKKTECATCHPSSIKIQ
ncbi:MAG: hypothetical protein KDC45_10755 [Bacteroidetes bacterium]|nr:hypothetical protein [Bacteroidota bacterium]